MSDIPEDVSLYLERRERALQEVRVLLAMLRGQSAPYVVWLSNLDRRLSIKLGKVNG